MTTDSVFTPHFHSGGVLPSPDDYRFVGASLPQLNAQEVVDALSRWDGMEDTIALFSDLLNKNGMCSHNAQWMFDLLRPLWVVWFLLHVCYSQAARDTLKVFVATVQNEKYTCPLISIESSACEFLDSKQLTALIQCLNRLCGLGTWVSVDLQVAVFNLFVYLLHS